MFIGIQTKILLTVLAIVLLFTFFSLFYFPSQQRQSLLNNYKNEVHNQAKTIALGASIALNEENFEGIKTAMDFVKENEALKFVALLQTDTAWNASHSQYSIKDTILVSFPENKNYNRGTVSNDSLIVKRASFRTSSMDGDILLAFSTDAIKVRQRKIQLTALVVSGIIFIVGMLIGLWLSRSISRPVLALRKAAKRVGEGDLSAAVKGHSKDEIGELAIAFNSMVQDIKKLSELTLEQEKEKQQFLASQNELLEKQVDERTAELRQSLEELKAAQAQLVQSEKMASLGELTAGIAHEIQNPLNFVNNFSELNGELLEEMKQEIDKNNFGEVKSMADDIISNEEKINHHGKRADAIVKGMLQHSRQSGVKELSDINALAEEYLKLSYHGLRAKDKSFNATMKTDFDTTIGKINIIPQDIGRVIMNLLTNAFYAVNEKKQQQPETYQPTVTVQTKKTGSNIFIYISDNGNGVPRNIIDKIFQPFFTTKPTGQGTGLGLSLSYDIVTKGHGGELKVETTEGEGLSAEAGTTFTIILPTG